MLPNTKGSNMNFDLISFNHRRLKDGFQLMKGLNKNIEELVEKR
jgi:hypothetical protein